MSTKHSSVATEPLLTVIRSVMDYNGSEIGHNDRLFLQRIFGEGLNKYIQRLQAIRFFGKERVLDAGCGYGQWSLALAGMNKMVECCDISPFRVRFLDAIADQLGVTNLTTKVSGIELMPYPDNHFDVVFCYGVIFLTPWRQSLVELARVLKPGGRLYVNANGLGWYMFLWQEEHNRAEDYDPKAIAAKCLSDTLAYDREGIYEPGMNLVIEPVELLKGIKALGFSKIKLGPEGCLSSQSSEWDPQPFFIDSFGSVMGVYEIFALKPKRNKKPFDNLKG